MIDHPLTSYNLALAFDSDSPQLQHKHAQSLHEFDYLSRRMSSSATSDSSLQSRPDKRAPSPIDSPLPKKPRPDPAPWPPATDSPSPHPTPDLDHPKHDLDHNPRVQLPSLASAFHDRYDHRRASLPTLYSESSAARFRPYPSQRPPPSSTIASYQFPPIDPDDKSRPRLAADTQLGLYNPGLDYASISSTAVSSNSPNSFHFSPLTPDYAQRAAPPIPFSSDSDHWVASSIVRPSSTPGNLAGPPLPPKYDDSLRHSSLGGPVSQQHLFGGVSRISGHSSRPVKSEADQQWNFPNADFAMSPPAAPSYPSTPSTSASAPPPAPGSTSPSRSPQAQAQQPAPAGLIERPPRKRGKLPKPVTDFLKDWLHRHSDHPYPSEEEKKQLCNATGLSMSQVSNWMINARRRILAPAHRAAAGPTTTTPFAPRGSLPTPAPGGGGPGGLLDAGRRASMPTDSLQLYYPLSLQSLHTDPARHGHAMQQQHHNPHQQQQHQQQRAPTLGYGAGDGYGRGYSTLGMGGGGGGVLHPHAQAHSAPGGYVGVPLGAPSALGSAGFLGAQPHAGMYGGGYHHGGAEGAGARYAFPEHSVSPQPGSGYATPQG